MGDGATTRAGLDDRCRKSTKEAAGGRGKGEGSLVGPSTPVSRVVGQRCGVAAGLSPMGMGSLPMDGKPERSNKWLSPEIMCPPLDNRQAWDAWKGSSLSILPAGENSGDRIVHSMTGMEQGRIGPSCAKPHRTAKQ